MLFIKVARIWNQKEELSSYGCYAIVNNCLHGVLTPHDQQGQKIPSEGDLRFIIKSTSKSSQVLRSSNVDLKNLPESGSFSVKLFSNQQSENSKWELQLEISEDMKDIEQAEPTTEHLLIVKAENEQLKARLSHMELNYGRLEARVADLESELEMAYNLASRLREEINEKEEFIKILEDDNSCKDKHIETLEDKLDNEVPALDLPIEDTPSSEIVCKEELLPKCQSARLRLPKVDVDSLLDDSGAFGQFEKISDGIYKCDKQVLNLFVRDKKLYVKEKGRTLSISDFLTKKNENRYLRRISPAGKTKSKPSLGPMTKSAKSLSARDKKQSLSIVSPVLRGKYQT